MIAAVDTNILLDILLDDEQFYESSKQLLEKQNMLIISPVVYAELLTQFVRKFSRNAEQQLDKFLVDIDVDLAVFSKDDLRVAAESWAKHAKRKDVYCPKCGKANKVVCIGCRNQIVWRNHIITDFLVGAHAQNKADVLLTRDRGFYGRHFKVKLHC